MQRKENYNSSQQLTKLLTLIRTVMENNGNNMNGNNNGEPKFWDRPIVKWGGRVLIAAAAFVGGMFVERKRGKKQ